MNDIFEEKVFDINEVKAKLAEARQALEIYKEKLPERKYTTMLKLWNVCADFYLKLCLGEIPTFELCQRTNSNITLDETENVWIFSDGITTKTAKTARGSRQIALIAYTADFLCQQLKDEKSSAIRELYYISESWPIDESYTSQDESNLMLEVLEIALECDRSDFSMEANANGLMAGPVVISETTRSGRERIIDCMKDTNDGGFPINPDLEKVKILSTTAKFVLAIESGGAYKRCLESRVDERYNCILIDLEGQPSRATKRMIKRLNVEQNLPVAAFLDCDPWSVRILLSIMSGSTKTAHLSKDFATPSVIWLGVLPTDITRFTLSTDKLKDSDKNALNELLRDPRIVDNPKLIHQIKYLIGLNRKCEQQSLAKYGLNYMADTYLPLKLYEAGLITEEMFKMEFTPSKVQLIEVSPENSIVKE